MLCILLIRLFSLPLLHSHTYNEGGRSSDRVYNDDETEIADAFCK